MATNRATVTVNDHQAYRKGNYFWDQLTLNNSAAPVWAGVTNRAVLNNGSSSDIIASNIGNVYLPKTPEQFGCDADGNLTNDGRWAYVWDAENRLVQMLPTGVVAVPEGAKRKLEFTYDYKGRRIQKSVSTWNGTGWTLTVSNPFLYDGWNVVAELNATNNAVVRSYLWGLDLSGY